MQGYGLAPLEAELKDAVTQTYQLELRLNPEDFNILSQLMGDGEPRLQHLPFIRCKSDDSAPRGSLAVPPDRLPVLPVDNLVRSLEKMLSEASTK